MENKLKLSKFEQARAKKIILSSKENLDVNLEGYTVLTEAGSNHYLFSPIIPLICGASKVFAFVKDTSYGSAEDIKDTCLEIASDLGLKDKLQIATNHLPENWLMEADIITNSGMLRPFNREKISKFKKGAVLPLMFEAWELRDQDIDIRACKEHGITVAGTWENHPFIKVFDYVMILCLKLAMEAGYEVMGNSIFIWSDDHFGEKIKKSFIQNGAKQCFLSTDPKLLFEKACDLDFIFIADYDEKQDYEILLDLKNLIVISPNIGIIHLYGILNIERVKNLGLKVYPEKNGKAELMTYTLAHVGMNPLINLQVAGYRVAQEMLQGEYTNISQPII
jgi:hypothetical protein